MTSDVWTVVNLWAIVMEVLPYWAVSSDSWSNLSDSESKADVTSSNNPINEIVTSIITRVKVNRPKEV